ncbi:unnamed protein product [Moneuplotes crassus]|uniref:Uncharacterized protein n=1 Tax=Euplotes crassus TaxID=5936 RepID=A0AAD1XER9_EUPCR|nr:unnamed protein product [Moneuplotes crassus]
MSFNGYKDETPSYSSSNSFTKPSYTNSVDQFQELKSLLKKMNGRENGPLENLYFTQNTNSFMSLDPQAMLNFNYDNSNSNTTLEKVNSDDPEFQFSFPKSSVTKKKRSHMAQRAIRKKAKFMNQPKTLRDNFQSMPEYKINLSDLHKKVVTNRVQNKRLITPRKPKMTRDFYQTLKNDSSRIIDNESTDLSEITEESSRPMNCINNTIRSKNIKNKDVEIIKIEPKNADTSLISSASQSSDLGFINPPEIKKHWSKNTFGRVESEFPTQRLQPPPSLPSHPPQTRPNPPPNPHPAPPSKRFDYKYKKRLIKKPKRRVMLPKRVETYEDVIKRLYDTKPARNE